MVSSIVSSRSREKVLGGLRIGRILITGLGGNLGYPNLTYEPVRPRSRLTDTHEETTCVATTDASVRVIPSACPPVVTSKSTAWRLPGQVDRRFSFCGRGEPSEKVTCSENAR